MMESDNLPIVEAMLNLDYTILENRYLISKRCEFFKTSPEPNESTTHYIQRLLLLSPACTFDTFSVADAILNNLLAYSYLPDLEAAILEHDVKLENVFGDDFENCENNINHENTVKMDFGSWEQEDASKNENEWKREIAHEGYEEIDMGENVVFPKVEMLEEEGEVKEDSGVKLEHRLQTKYSCQKCSKVFVNNSCFKKHKFTHLEKKFKCEECPKKFSRADSLLTHQRKHDYQLGREHFEPLPCNQCTKVFSSSVALKNHLYLHTGEKLFKCTTCEKAFVNSYRLMMHERTHTGEKPFSCNECDKRFISCLLYTSDAADE